MAELQPSLSKQTRTLWRCAWTPTGKADFALRVCIFDHAGILVYLEFYFAGIDPIGENRTQKLPTFLHQNQIRTYGRSHFYC